MRSAPLLEMRQISKRFGNTQALDRVNFSAVAGEVHAISGENGAGKSTLMKILSGAVQSDSGEVLLDGKPVTIHSPRDAHALGIHTVYQEFSLVGHLSVTEKHPDGPPAPLVAHAADRLAGGAPPRARRAHGVRLCRV